MASSPPPPASCCCFRKSPFQRKVRVRAQNFEEKGKSAPPPASCCCFRKSPFQRKVRVRAQNFEEKGKSADIVGSNMDVLRRRIEQVRVKEKLERCCRRGEGWLYKAGYDVNLKRQQMLFESMETAALMAITLGFTFLSGTLGLCLFSLTLHLC